VDGLSFSYPQHPVLINFSTRITAGVSLLQGGDGRGKSTLLRLMAGVLAADAGELTVRGVSLTEEPQAYRQKVFWVDPRTDAMDATTPQTYFESLRLQFPNFDSSGWVQLIQGLSLAPHMDKFFYMLSTGTKRKVWLAAAMASGADVILLDEPFAALDKASIGFVVAQLVAIAKQSSRACVFSHYEAALQIPLQRVIDLGD
jgi:ABC-type multidrug transport system ATPase subunit